MDSNKRDDIIKNDDEYFQDLDVEQDSFIKDVDEAAIRESLD